MGNPLSAVLAPLYMETLEEDHFKTIVGRDVTWLRYCDDIIALLPDTVDIQTLLQELNSVEASIQFTVEEEQDSKLAFLDVLIHRLPTGLHYSVYRKPTNKDDLIHYFSAHSDRVKSGVVIGFYLRAMRICSPEYLQDELDYIVKAFLGLKFPLAMLIRLQKTAKEHLAAKQAAGSEATHCGRRTSIGARGEGTSCSEATTIHCNYERNKNTKPS